LVNFGEVFQKPIDRQRLHGVSPATMLQVSGIRSQVRGFGALCLRPET
jgi:hypothetical protein